MQCLMKSERNNAFRSTRAHILRQQNKILLHKEFFQYGNKLDPKSNNFQRCLGRDLGHICATVYFKKDVVAN